MPVSDTKKQMLIVLPLDLEERLRAFLTDPAKGYVPRGAQSAFIAEAIKDKLDKGESVSFDTFFDMMENPNG